MKKLISFLFVFVIFCVSIFSVNVFANDDENSLTETTMTETYLKELRTTDEISIKISFDKKTKFLPIDDDYILSTKDGKVSICGTSRWFLKVNVIFDNGITSVYFPSLPFFYIKGYNPNHQLDFYMMFTAVTNIPYWMDFSNQFIQSYEKDIDGKTYYIEEFNDGSIGVYRFYYFGNELVKIELANIQDDSLNQGFDINISRNVDNGLFTIPSSAIIDLSFLFPVF